MKVTDKKIAGMIERGYVLDQAMKEMKIEFESIKDELKGLGDGTYDTKKGRKVVIASSPKYTDIDPTEAMDYLKKNKLKKQFGNVFKVTITSFKKLAGEVIMNGMRQEIGATVRASFK